MSFAGSQYDFSDKLRAYGELARDLEHLLALERNWIANAANAAALIYGALPDLNWAGFYLPVTSPSGASSSEATTRSSSSTPPSAGCR